MAKKTVPVALATILLDGVQVPNLELITVERSVGGQREDTAVMRINNDELFDIGLAGSYVGKKCHITLSRDGQAEVIHVGRIVETDFGLGDGMDNHIVSRLEKYHISRRLSGIHCLNRYTDSIPGPFGTTLRTEPKAKPIFIDQPTTFNPYYEDKIIGNRHHRVFEGKHYYFLDFEACRTNRSLAWHTEGFAEDVGVDDEWIATVGNLRWTPADAVHYLCWTLNPNEHWVLNPTDDRYNMNRKLFPDEDPDGGFEDILIDRTIKEGSYLGEALDELLGPYNITWFLDYSHVGPYGIAGKPRIVLRRLGASGSASGTSRTLKYAKNGDADYETTNIRSFRLSVDMGRNLANTVTVIGDYPQREIGVELQWPWRAAKGDEVTNSPNIMRSDSDEFRTDPEIQRVWREYWGNEAGDTVNLKTNSAIPGATTTYREPNPLFIEAFQSDELTDIPTVALDRVHPAAKTKDFYVHAMHRRKKFLPTITETDDGVPVGNVDGCYVEFTRDGRFAVARNWTDLSTVANVSMLEDMAGIRVESVAVPTEIVGVSDPALYVQATACIAGDVRVRQAATTLDSPNPDPVELFIDAKKYTVKQRDISSRFALSFLAFGVDSADDRAEMAKHAKRILAEYNRLDAVGNFTLIGMNHEIQLCDRIVKIAGRNIDLNAGSVARPSYPQVIQIVYDHINQATVLVVCTHKDIPRIQ